MQEWKLVGPYDLVIDWRPHSPVIDWRPVSTPIRDGQYVIRDRVSGGISFLPPEASAVPTRMAILVAWINGG